MESIIVQPGETKTAYWFVNLSGTLYYKINNRSGTHKLKAQWVKGPFGSTEDIPDLYLQGNIPFKGFIWGKLKVFGADSETVMQVTDSARVASNFPSIHF